MVSRKFGLWYPFRILAIAVVYLLSGTFPYEAHASSESVETLVFIRHGEKQEEGLGQLSCQGLSRALALPMVIAKKFGKPDAVFAPDPGEMKHDGAGSYYYVRPLATVEPMAIEFHMPVQTPFGVTQIAQQAHSLVDPVYRGKLVVIGWEHHLLVKMVREILASDNGAAISVPSWANDDFDSIYVVTLDWRTGTPRASFRTDREDLNGRPVDCPALISQGGE